MRKPTLLALTTLTALGATAVASTSYVASLGNTTLTSARKTESADLLSSLARSRSPVPTSLFILTTLSGGRDLVALHDIRRVDTANLSQKTGLPIDKKRHKRPHVSVSSTSLIAATPATTATPTTAGAAPAGGVWYQLRMCESGDNYAEDTGNGYYGAYQFSLQTWYGLGLSGLPSSASAAVQDQAAQALQARSGWNQWPQCAVTLGL